MSFNTTGSADGSPDGSPALGEWAHALRSAGRARFQEVGFPNKKQEEWRFTNIAPIASAHFAPAAPGTSEEAADLVARYSFNTDAAIELVFVNGRYVPQLSRLHDIGEDGRSRDGRAGGGIRDHGGTGHAGLAGRAGVEATHFGAVSEGRQELLAAHVGRHARIEANPFVALNSALFVDGAFIFLGRGTLIEKPIHVLHVSTSDGGALDGGASDAAASDGAATDGVATDGAATHDGRSGGRGNRNATASHPRILLIAEENAEATLVESYVGATGVYLTNAVTEIVAGPECRLDHCKLQQEGMEAFHIASMHVDLGRAARFVSHSASIGSRLARNDLAVAMNGEFADATLNGLVLASGSQHIDNHTLLDHAKPNCPSHELYKHVLADKASAVFKGKILVRPDAQKTDSKQTSKALLLSDDALMNSQPALEIYADDVKCTHGSTTGPVDEEQVFYMRSRGVGLEAARHLMTYAFAADITRRIRVEPVRRRLETFMAQQHNLPQDLRISELGSHDEAVVNL